MAESDGQEKTEEPTGKRLQETREKGQVAKSQELNSLAIFGTGLIMVYMVKEHIGVKLADLAKFIFNSLDSFYVTKDMLTMFGFKAIGFFVATCAPIFGALMAIGLIAGYGQAGFKITPKALAPKMEVFDPIKGIKKKFFTTEPIVELLKSVFKLVIIGGFTYWVLEDAIVEAIGLIDFSISSIVNFILETVFNLVFKICLVYAVIAAADFAYRKYKHKKDMKMTKQEVKEENKQQEGDPHVKGQIKGKQLAMARSRMMKEVPTADVVITNPTHFAVALKYDLEKDNAPKVVAKGMDFMAQKIKQIAAENNIPMHEDVPLARALYKACEVGDEIPDKLFQAVAQILAYVYNLKRAKKKNSIV